MIAAVVTGATCNDPTGGHPEDNFLKGPSQKVDRVQGSHRPTTTPEVLATQVAQMACNDQGRVFYCSGAIVMAAAVTEATFNDPIGGHPEDNFLKRSSLESG